MGRQREKQPSIEDIGELSGIEILHPGGLDLSKRIGELVDMKGKEVLEIACGRGLFACYYAKNYQARITGLDINPDMIKACVSRAQVEGVEDLTKFKRTDALNLPLPFADNSFDVVISECALGLASNPQEHIKEMERVVNVGGYIVLHFGVWRKDIQNKPDIEKRIGGVLFAFSDVKDMLKEAGITEIHYEDWSGIEQMGKIRPERRIQKVDDLFTLNEKKRILFGVLRRFGLKGLLYLNESVKKVTPLYYNGALGYYLIAGQKPREAHI